MIAKVVSDGIITERAKLLYQLYDTQFDSVQTSYSLLIYREERGKMAGAGTHGHISFLSNDIPVLQSCISRSGV